MSIYAYDPNQNYLIAALPENDFERMEPHLELIKVKTGDVLYESGGRLPYVYFPVTSTISLQNLMENGSSSEIAGIGREGMLGTMLLMGGQTMPCRALVQIAGYAYRVRADVLLREFNQTGATFRLLLRYTQSLITQTTQTAVCNRHHSIEQQLCRWLLLTNERVNCDEIAVTQEAIANVLGVRREGITEAAGYLQDLRYISYRRGHITILNQRGLEEHVCECYGVVKKEFHRLMDHACESHAHRTPGIRLLSPIFPPTFPPVIPPVYPPTGLMSNQWRK